MLRGVTMGSYFLANIDNFQGECKYIYMNKEIATNFEAIKLG